MDQDGTPGVPPDNTEPFQQLPGGQQVPPQQGYQQPGQHQGVPAQQPYPTYPPGYVQAPHYPEESNAVAALVISILSLAMCSGLISPIGWIMANKELAGIAEGRRDPTKRDMAKAAQVISIVGSVLLGLAALFFGGFLLLAVLGAFAGAAT